MAHQGGEILMPPIAIEAKTARATLRRLWATWPRSAEARHIHMLAGFVKT